MGKLEEIGRDRILEENMDLRDQVLRLKAEIQRLHGLHETLEAAPRETLGCEQLRASILKTAARSILADAAAHREKWCDGRDASAWDKGFVRGKEHAAHTIANSIDQGESND